MAYGFDKEPDVSMGEDSISDLESFEDRVEGNFEVKVEADLGVGVTLASYGNSSAGSRSHSGISDGQLKRRRRKL